MVSMPAQKLFGIVCNKHGSKNLNRSTLHNLRITYPLKASLDLASVRWRYSPPRRRPLKFVCHAFISLRDKRTPKDVCGEATLDLAFTNFKILQLMENAGPPNRFDASSL